MQREVPAIRIPVVMKARAVRLMNHIRVYVTRDTKGRTVKVSTGSIISYLI